MSGKLDQAFGVQSAALSLRVKRQSAIASNIANADTPGYRAVDIDFSRALKNAIAQPTTGAKAIQTSAPLEFRVPGQTAADGNTVDMDVERARFAENTIRYEAALKAINGQIKTLLSAIQG